VRASCKRASDGCQRGFSKHDPEPKDRVSEKWEPVFGKDHAQSRTANLQPALPLDHFFRRHSGNRR